MWLWGNPVFVSYKEQIACTAVQAPLQDDVIEEAHGETPEQMEMDGEGERAEDGSDHEQEDALGRICCCASIVGC